MVSEIIIGALILGGALLLALSRKPKPVAPAWLPAKPPVEEKPTLPPDMFTISVSVTYRGDEAYATMPLRGLVRIDPPPYGREIEWKPLQPTYSKRVVRGDHSIQIESPFAGRNFIHWLVLPDTAILQTGNPLTLFINENKHLTAEFT